MTEFRPNSAPVHPYHVPPKRTVSPVTIAVALTPATFIAGFILGRLIGGAG